MNDQGQTGFDIDTGAQGRVIDQDQEKPYEETEIPDCASAGAIAKDAAQEALEGMYENEFPIDDPPDSWERFEAELALRALASAAQDWSKAAPDQKSIVELELDEQTPDQIVQHKKQHRSRFIELAKTNIDTMATYGQLAEENVAWLTQAKVVDLEIKEYAAETLADMREESTETKSLTAAIREWWHGG